MKFITLGELSWYLVLLLIAPIIACSRSYIVTLLNQNKFQNHPFVLTFLMFLGELIGGSLQIVLYLKQKRRKSKKKQEFYMNSISKFKTQTISPFDQLEKNQDIKWPKTNYLVFLGLAIIDLAGMSLIVMLSSTTTTFDDSISANNHNDKLNNLDFQIKTCQMIIAGLLSIKMLRYPILKHQLLSMLLIFIGMIVIILDALIEVNTIPLITKIGVLILSYAIYAFEEVSQKYLMEFKFVSPFYILIYKGLFGILLCLLLFLVFGYIDCPKGLGICQGEKIELIFDTLRKINYFENPRTVIELLSLYCLMCLLYNVLIGVIIKIYSPTQKAVSDIIASLFWECMLLATNQLFLFSAFYLILHFVGYVLMGIGILIYNEIIIVYLFGFSDYTSKEITLRAKDEDQNNQELSQINIDVILLNED